MRYSDKNVKKVINLVRLYNKKYHQTVVATYTENGLELKSNQGIQHLQANSFQTTDVISTLNNIADPVTKAKAIKEKEVTLSSLDRKLNLILAALNQPIV